MTPARTPPTAVPSPLPPLPPLPFTPMLATSGPLPSGEEWAYELKWDGVRTLAAIGPDGTRMWSRAQHDITAGYPELARATSPEKLLLDAEIVAIDPATQVPSFGLLQRRMHVRDPRQLARLLEQVPVEARVFDVLGVGGDSLLDTVWEQRRGVLDGLELDLFWERSPVEDTGLEAFERTREIGMEGVVAKRRNSRYLPGRRTRDWIKVKHASTRDGVIVGWHPGRRGSAREGSIGSLYLGAYDDDALVLIGKVGSGLGAEMRDLLQAELGALERPDPPVDVSSVPATDRRSAHWLEPALVCEVEHLGWGADGRLRAPVWRGLRLDIPPDAVRR